MFITNKELDARIDYACRIAVKKALETERNSQLCSKASSIFQPKSEVVVLQERVEALEKEGTERARRLEAWKIHREAMTSFINTNNTTTTNDIKFRCGTPVFYQDPIRNRELLTATVQQHLGRGWCVIEICSTGNLVKVPMSSLIRIQKEGAK